MSNGLMLHSGARLVTHEELERVEAPPATQTWFPLRHAHVLERAKITLDAAGFQVQRESYALTADNHRFFATLDLRSEVSGGVTLSVGVRNSTDKSFPIGLVAGSRVFVCDNLSFSSEIVVSRKHTRFGERRFVDAIATAVGSLRQYQGVASQRIAWMQSEALSEDAANSLILQTYEKEIVGPRLLPTVIDQWRHPKHDEFAPRNVWSLMNAYTEALKPRQLSQPTAAAHETIRLQRLLTQRMPNDGNTDFIEVE